MSNMEVVYLHFNDWEHNIDYPPIYPIDRLVSGHVFWNEQFVEQNKLAVLVSHVDMSVNFCITAPKEWVMEYCPEVLTDYTYAYHYPSGLVETKHYSDFVCHPEDGDDEVYDEFGFRFLPYEEEYIGKVIWDEEEEEEE